MAPKKGRTKRKTGKAEAVSESESLPQWESSPQGQSSPPVKVKPGKWGSSLLIKFNANQATINLVATHLKSKEQADKELSPSGDLQSADEMVETPKVSKSVKSGKRSSLPHPSG